MLACHAGERMASRAVPGIIVLALILVVAGIGGYLLWRPLPALPVVGVVRATEVTWSKLAFRARGVLVGSAASIPITHCTPFNQHRLTLCRQYFLARLMDVDDLVHDLGD